MQLQSSLPRIKQDFAALTFIEELIVFGCLGQADDFVNEACLLANAPKDALVLEKNPRSNRKHGPDWAAPKIKGDVFVINVSAGEGERWALVYSYRTDRTEWPDKVICQHQRAVVANHLYLLIVSKNIQCICLNERTSRTALQPVELVH